jgi:hypothetical protein
MPLVERALIPMKDASEAIARALEAWNVSQLGDAIRSAAFFIGQAKKAISQGAAPDQLESDGEGGAA